MGLNKLDLIKVFVLVNLVACLKLNAGQIEYIYDSSGNRVTRQVIVLKSMDVPDGPIDTTKINENPGLPSEPVAPENYESFIGEMKILVYPNPTTSELKIELSNQPDGVETGLVMYDLSGHTIKEMKNLKENIQIDLNNTPNGTYIMRITLGGKTSEYKIVKE